MVGKTKCEAKLTREKILEAALNIFYLRGFHQSTLEEIAREAGMTRGAIYCHFENKTELLATLSQDAFRDLRQRLSNILDKPPAENPLNVIEAFLNETAQFLGGTSRTRLVHAILLSRCEASGQLIEIKAEATNLLTGFREKLRLVYRKAGAAGLLHGKINPDFAADDTLAFACGLLNNPVFIISGQNEPELADLVRAHMQLR